MTNSEKNTSNSENIGFINTQPIQEVPSLHFEARYAFIAAQSNHSTTFLSDTYFNIIVKDECQTISYQIDNTQYFLNGGENILHFAKKNTFLRIDSLSDHNQLLLICMPIAQLKAYEEQVASAPSLYKNGMMTKSDHRISLLVNNIFNCQTHSALQKLKLSALFLELLVLQLEMQSLKNSDSLDQNTLYEKIRKAREIIDNDISKTYSISELAKEVGTNEQYLKKYFKLYFNKTIQNYTTDRKMTYAKDLILAGNHRIVDVARLTGYKHATHFTTAFKKHFGFIPNSLKYVFFIFLKSYLTIAESSIENMI